MQLARSWMGACPSCGSSPLGCVPPGRVYPAPRPKPSSAQGPRHAMRQAIQLWALAGCGLRTPRRGPLREPEPGQFCGLWSRRRLWGRPGGTLRKAPRPPERSLKHHSRPLTLTLGAGGPADPAPSWPAQRLPLCGAPTLDPRGRARGGGWAEWHLQPHGVLGEFLRSSTARAQKTAASARMGGSRAPGRAGPGQAREGQAQCSGLHTARPGGRGPQGAHPPRGMDRQTGTRPVGVPPP